MQNGQLNLYLVDKVGFRSFLWEKKEKTSTVQNITGFGLILVSNSQLSYEPEYEYIVKCIE